MKAEGHVLFDVTQDVEYGGLSGRSQEDMLAGARVEVAPYKKTPAILCCGSINRRAAGLGAASGARSPAAGILNARR